MVRRRSTCDVKVTVRLPGTLATELDAQARREGRTLSDHMRRVLVDHAAAQIMVRGELAAKSSPPRAPLQ